MSIQTALSVQFLKAYNGDCIFLNLITDEGPRNILIDGGVEGAYERKKKSGSLKNLIESLRNRNQVIDLLIITHIDDDHIAGILKWFEKDQNACKIIREVWFNSGKRIANWLEMPENKDLDYYVLVGNEDGTSIQQGVELGKFLQSHNIWFNEVIFQGQVLNRFGIEFKILSPNRMKLEKLLKEWQKQVPDLNTSAPINDYSASIKSHISKDIFEEDTAYPNGSSIAFIMTVNGRNFLFLGDSHPSVVVEGLLKFDFNELNPVEACFVKLSHHGSKANTSPTLLNTINCFSYVILTDGAMHQHPHKQLLARIINLKKGVNFYFNYPDRSNMIFTEEDKKEYSFNILSGDNKLFF